MEYCIDLILISLKNTKHWLEHVIKKDEMMYFVYIVTYLGKILVLEWEISSLKLLDCVY